MDGDTDVPSVQQDFSAALYQLMRRASRKDDNLDFSVAKGHNGHSNKIHIVNEYQNECPRQVVNGVPDYVGKMVDATKNTNGIPTQGN